MKITFDKTKTRPQEKYAILHMNKEEAMRLVVSLSAQVGNNNPNHNLREDFTCEDGTILIAWVDPEKKINPKHLQPVGIPI